MIKRYTGRSLWLAGLMLTTLIAGCSGGGSSSSSSDLNAAPTVVETAPADTAIGVPLNSKVTATFSEAMDESTITTESFIVKGQDEDALIGTVVYDAESETASFVADRAFTAGIVYTATVTTIATNATGTPLAADHVWSFTTGATADETAPTVNSTNPEDGATGFPLNRDVSANFSEELDPATITASSFTLAINSTAVPGEFSYSSKVATFNPTTDFSANSTYTATLTTAIKDLAGNALATDFVWSFTTGEATAVAKGPAPVNLRTAGDFVILTKTGITNATIGASDIDGNIGSSPITAAAMNTVTCPEVSGLIYGADVTYSGSGDITCFRGDATANTLVANAVLDMGTAYVDAAGRTLPDFTELHAGDISGQTLVPGLYKWGTNVWINTDVTLAGGENDVWIFQIAQDVLQEANTKVILTGGALAKNVFWQVGGGTSVAIDTGATFQGVVLAAKAITLKTGATVNGRLLADSEVTLQSNTVAQPAP